MLTSPRPRWGFCTPDPGNLTDSSASGSQWGSNPNTRGTEEAGTAPTGNGGASTLL